MSDVREPEAPAALREIQSFLNDAFRRYAPITSDAELARLSAVHVSGNDRLTPAEQVDIYRRQYWMRHEESLREDFPTVVAILGEELWSAFVRDYLVRFPPTTPSLRDLGADVPRFLDTWPLVPADRAGLLRDAAQYELTFTDVFDGADPPALDPALVAALTPAQWESARFVLSGLVKRMRFDHPVHRLRMTVRDDPHADIAAWMGEHARPCTIALFRKDLVVHFEELEADAFLMLDALAEGRTLLEACASVAEGKAESEALALGQKVGAWFRRWSSWGFIAEIVVPGGSK